MKTLVLLRHAKSDWGDAGLDDFDRPLASRGRRAAPAMAEWMAGEGLVPERVLCSAARRTRETWALMEPILDVAAEHYEELYLASAARILELVEREHDESDRVMIVAHNPGTGVLASRLAARGSPELLRRMRDKFPTAALAVLDFDVERWEEVGRGGTLRTFVRPRDLE